MNNTEHLFVLFQEEALEVAHAVSKVLRFTQFDSRGPGHPTNMQHLCNEFNELMAVRDLLQEQGIDIPHDPEMIALKRHRIAEYMARSKSLGVLTDAGTH